MSVRLRPFEAVDYPRLIEINRRIYPDHPVDEAEWRHDDATWDTQKYDKLRLVAQDPSGTVVGWGQINHSTHYFNPRRYRVNVEVDPPWQRHGIGTALYERLLAEARSREAEALIATCRESLAESVAFLTRRGFVEQQREWESRLHVDGFDFARFAGAHERIAREGITIVALADERRSDPDAVRRAHAMYQRCEADVPSTEPFRGVSFEEWARRELEAPATLLDAFFLARSARGEYLGVSNLFRSLAEPGVIYQGLTGVLPEHRGRGIAMALKLRTVEYARANGYREIRTWNDTRNRPMLRINEAMGFVKQPAWIEFEKRLPGGAG